MLTGDGRFYLGHLLPPHRNEDGYVAVAPDSEPVDAKQDSSARESLLVSVTVSRQFNIRTKRLEKIVKKRGCSRDSHVAAVDDDVSVEGFVARMTRRQGAVT